jgi:hypothetical protein
MEAGAKRTVMRVELWHGLLLVGLLAALWPAKLIEPKALLIGGLFMALNFLLLSYGVAWVLTPLAGRGWIKAGVGLLVLKTAIFLALLSTLFWRFEIDALSFALGFSSLLAAVLIEGLRVSVRSEP